MHIHAGFMPFTSTLSFSLLVFVLTMKILRILSKTLTHTYSEKGRREYKRHYSETILYIWLLLILFLRCLDRKLDEDHLHKKAGWRWRQHTESMKAFQKIRATLEPTLEENQKRAPKSALTTHFSCRMGTGDGGRRRKTESKGTVGGTARGCRAVQNPLNQPQIVHGAMSSCRNTFTL